MALKTPATNTFTDFFYQSDDSLSLYARDYPKSDAPVILCLHGLTRNSADFEDIATHLHQNFRVICPDQRGRGRSEYDPNSKNYNIETYCRDMATLLEQLKIDDVIILGTSLGGLMAMVMAAINPTLISRIILNDIGPAIDNVGLQRIKSYLGINGPFVSWDDAASAVEKINKTAFPDYKQSNWLAFARRTCQEAGDQIQFAYDPEISTNVQADESQQSTPDLWALYQAIANIPTLIIRGGTSDILSEETVAKMITEHADIKSVTVQGIGHAPMLDEAEAFNAINTFLHIAPH